MSKRQLDQEFTPQSAWLDLINSQMWDGFGRLTDHLRNPGWVAGFLQYWNTRPEELGRKSARAELSELRDELRRSVEKVAAGRSLTRRDLHALNAFLRAPSYLQIVREGKDMRLERKPVRLNWRWVRSQIAASFVDSLQRGSSRIKTCDNPQCRWAFVDTTRGNIRRWCRDRRCGNRFRVRRARARAKERRS